MDVLIIDLLRSACFQMTHHMFGLARLDIHEDMNMIRHNRARMNTVFIFVYGLAEASRHRAGLNSAEFNRRVFERRLRRIPQCAVMLHTRHGPEDFPIACRRAAGRINFR